MLNATTQAHIGQTIILHQGYFSRRTSTDWIFALVMMAATALVFTRHGASMDFYEQSILLGAVPALIWMGWFWRPLRLLMVGAGALALLAIWLYRWMGRLIWRVLTPCSC